MRELRVVHAADAFTVRDALRDALTGDGPAILPVPAGADPVPLPAGVPRKVALVVQTSGSTGNPKRVALAADALLAGAAAAEAALGAPGQWLLALPVHYIAGLNVLTRSIAAGTDPVVLPPGPFDPLEFIEAAVALDHPVRFTSLVPAQLLRLIETDAALTALRRFNRILVGGQSTPTTLLAQALELGLNVTRTYGSSETSGGCVYDGVPIGATTVRVVGGQIELGGPMLAEGYVDDEERTAAAFYVENATRWYRTGDTGELRDGVLSVTGRIDGGIVSGGVNVSLSEVERVVCQLPGMAEAVVVSRRHERWGEVPVVVCVSVEVPELAVVRSYVSSALGQAAAPDAVVRIDRLPLLSSGKPDRVALAAMVAAQGGTAQ